MTAQATVTIPLNEFLAIQEAKSKAELETSTVKQQLSSMKIAASDQTLLVVARAALDVVRFAVANLPPETTKNWPTNSLRKVATELPSMPDSTVDDHELSITLSTFADECDRFEDRRRGLASR